MYGMANTGKTFTMFGDIDYIGIRDVDPGIGIIQIKELFWKIQLMKRQNNDKNVDGGTK